MANIDIQQPAALQAPVGTDHEVHTLDSLIALLHQQKAQGVPGDTPVVVGTTDEEGYWGYALRLRQAGSQLARLAHDDFHRKWAICRVSAYRGVKALVLRQHSGRTTAGATNPGTRRDVEATLRSKYEAGVIGVGLFAVDFCWVVMATLDGDLVFRWFDKVEQIADLGSATPSDAAARKDTEATLSARNSAGVVGPGLFSAGACWVLMDIFNDQPEFQWFSAALPIDQVLTID